jgi:hypothetical protein
MAFFEMPEVAQAGSDQLDLIGREGIGMAFPDGLPEEVRDTTGNVAK